MDKVKLNEAAILEKVKTGVELSPEETEFVAGNPNLEGEPAPAAEEEEADEAKIKDGDAGEEEEPGAEATPEPEAGEEETPEGEEPPEKKPTEQGPAAKQTPEERRKLINAELDKPDGQVDLSKFTPTEIGLYWDLKKERRARQKAEQKNRVNDFKEIQRALKEDEKPEGEEGAEGESEDPLKVLADMDDDDIPTVGQLKKILAGAKKAPKEKAPPAPAKSIRTIDQIRFEKIEANDRLKAKGITDFYDVVDYAEAALAHNPDAQEELRETALAGGNVVEKTYFLIKGSKRWPEIEKAIKAEKNKGKADPDNKDRAERIKKNEVKVKTTGPSGGGAAPTGEYTVEQIMAMSPREFGALPKKTQDAILIKYGSEPNLSI